jgi:ribulose-phosphate 3-epimerase
MVDQVLVMTVNPWLWGPKVSCLKLSLKIAQLDQSAKKLTVGTTYDIEIDGGVNNADTVVACYEAGATVAVAGSYVFNDADPVAKMNTLKDVTK